MRLRNSTDFADTFLRRLVSWCCRALGYPARRLRAAQFTRTRSAFRGRAWQSRRILVRIGDDDKHAYPQQHKYPGRVYAPEYTLSDRMEALLMVTAHEIAHLARWHDGIGRTREARVDGMALAVLEKFRPQRDELLAEWGRLSERKATPKLSVVDRRAAKTADDLARWQRKAKLAATKIRKLKARMRYYEKRQAATSCVKGAENR